MRFLFCLIGIVLILSMTVLAQSIGVSLGTGTYNYAINAVPPVNINAHFYYQVSDIFTLGFNGGYGWSNYESEENYEDINIEDHQRETNISGFPLEIEALFFLPFAKGGKLEAFLGIGGGYYNYKIKFKEGFDSNFFNGEKDTEGLAQYITAGLKFNLNSKLTAFLQLKKMILSSIEEKGDMGYYENATYKHSIRANPGLYDIGIAMGFIFGF